MKTNNVIVVDCETTGLSWEEHEVCQLAAMAFDGGTMEPIRQGGTFESLLRPLKPETIQDQALKVNGLSRELLENAVHPRVVWGSFVRWVQAFNLKGNGILTAPILAGKNVRNFDIHFLNRLGALYSPKKEKEVLFNRREQIDLEDLLRQWFWSNPTVEKMSMDYLRERFKMKTDRAHSALGDVEQTGRMIQYFMQLTRDLQQMKTADGRKLIDFDAAFQGI